jgi:hypothetical protein
MARGGGAMSAYELFPTGVALQRTACGGGVRSTVNFIELAGGPERYSVRAVVNDGVSAGEGYHR